MRDSNIEKRKHPGDCFGHESKQDYVDFIVIFALDARIFITVRLNMSIMVAGTELPATRWPVCPTRRQFEQIKFSRAELWWRPIHHNPQLWTDSHRSFESGIYMEYIKMNRRGIKKKDLNWSSPSQAYEPTFNRGLGSGQHYSYIILLDLFLFYHHFEIFVCWFGFAIDNIS